MISIALATYNGENFIREQLNSFYSQTLSFDELVICDDGSIDGTIKILKEYQSMDSRIKLYFNETNLGFVKNFEKAINLCKGDYIALSDQDDIWMPNHLEVLSKIIEDNMIAVGDSIIIDIHGKSLGEKLSQRKNFNKFHDSNHSILRFFFYYLNPFQGANMLINRKFIDKLLPIPDNIYFHDVWFIALASLLEQLKVTPEVINGHRIHGNNASSYHPRHHPYRALLSHLFKSYIEKDRLPILKELTDKYGNFNENCSSLLNEFNEYFCRRRNVWGRLRNLIFEINNYNKFIK